MKPNNIKVLILTDYLLLYEGLEKIIEKTEDISVVARSNNIKEIINEFKKFIPDVIIIDLNAYETGVSELHHYIEVNKLSTKILLLINGCDEETVLRNVSVGVHGCLHKGASADDLIKAIRAVTKEDVWLTRRLVYKLLNQYSHPVSDGNALTVRENEVAQLIAQGLKNREIAERLFISEKTIKSHVTNIFIKKGVNNRIKLTLKMNLFNNH